MILMYMNLESNFTLSESSTICSGVSSLCLLGFRQILGLIVVRYHINTVIVGVCREIKYHKKIVLRETPGGSITIFLSCN